MKFAQIVEIETQSYGQIEELLEKWRAATEGERTSTSELICEDRDRSSTYLLIVEFPSYEEAMRNNALPATEEIAQGLEAIASAPLKYRNLDVIRAVADR